jgi:hypothetical protein
MHRRLLLTCESLLAAATLVLFSGCAMFRASTTELDPNQPKHMSNKYDYTDLHALTQTVTGEFLASPLMARQAQPPMMRLGTIQNRTSQHVDTKALSEQIRTLLLQSNKVQFVSETQREELLKEQDYQARNATRDTQVAAGQQLGPRYMLTGSLVEITQASPREVRISRKEVSYYNLIVEVTDLQSGKIEWTTQKEITRQASQPLIGW